MLLLADAVGVAERSQGILKEDLATGIMVFMGLAIVGLAVYIRFLVKDLRELTKEAVQAIERVTASNATLTRTIDQRTSRRRAPSLGQEPKTGAGE